MITPELKKYVRDATQAGLGSEVIQRQLLAAGWNIQEITKAFQTLEQPVAIVQRTPRVQNGAMDTFTPIQKNRQNFKKFAIVVVCLLVLGIGGGGAYAYYMGYFASPEKVFIQALTAMQHAKSVTIESTVSIDASASKDRLPFGVSDQATLVFTGAYDLSNKEVPQFQGTIDLQSGMFAGGFAMRFVNNIFYGELTKLKIPDLPLPIDFNEYLNTWYSFELVKNNTVDPIISSMVPELELEKGKEFIEGITSEQKDHLEQIFQNAHFITNIQKVGLEKINGVNSYHFTFDLDHAGIKQFIADASTYTQSIDTTGNGEKLLDADLKAMSDTYDTISSKITHFTGDMWISKSDHLLQKLSVNFGIIDKDFLPEELKFSLVVNFTNWNKPVEIQAPTNSTIISSLFESTFGNLDVTQTKTQDTKIKSIIASSRTQAMVYIDAHNNSYIGFCLSPDMRENYNQMKELGIPISNVICKETPTAYAISVKLPDDTFMCADSTGEFGSTEKHITTTECLIK